MVRVLYVDDERSLLEVTKFTLERREGMDVDVASSANEALGMMDRTRYDVIISDYQMPDMDGIDFLKRIRSFDKDIPFILFTGKGREEIAIQALNIGADFYVKKGGETESLFAVLANTIRQAMKNRDAEDALIYNMRRFRYLVENISDVVAMVNREGTMGFVGPSCERVLGLSPSKLTGSRLVDLVDPSDRGLVERVLGTAASPDAPKERITVRIRVDGELRFFNLMLSHIEDGKSMLTMTDITETKSAQDALAKKVELEETLMNITTRFINPSTIEEIRQFTSDAIATLTDSMGAERGFIYALSNDGGDLELRDSCVLRNAPPMPDRLDPTLLDRCGTDALSTTLGSRRALCAPLIRDGKRTGVVGFDVVVEDVTWDRGEEALLGVMSRVFTNIYDRVDSKRALELADHKTNLLGHVTRHDILNQVAVMKGYLGLMETQEDPERLKRYTTKLSLAADKIQSQLDFNRKYEMMGTEEPVWVDVARLVNGVFDRMEMDGVRLEMDIGGLRILADPLMEKALENILSNSEKHGGHVTTVTVGHSDDPFRLVISDDGVGIGGDEKSLIFNHGYGKNYGYGLHLVREILSITDMDIEETGEPGAGARMEILVPEGNYRFV